MKWTLITLDNVDHVYDITDSGFVLFAYVDSDSNVYCGTKEAFSASINTMAKFGNYYYIEIPKLNKTDTNDDTDS